jgi:glycopeptide antibiotics resistance protein
VPPPSHADPRTDREFSVSPGGSVGLPWLLPGVAIAVVVSIATSGVVGRAFRVRRSVAWAGVLSLGIILAATLTPQGEALLTGARGSSSCNMSRIWPVPLGDFLSLTEASINVLMFIPLGAVIGLVPRSRRKGAIVVAAIALPFAIETVQLLVPALDRACESADVVDNLTGLAIGLAVGVVTRRFVVAADPRPG